MDGFEEGHAMYPQTVLISYHFIKVRGRARGVRSRWLAGDGIYDRWAGEESSTPKCMFRCVLKSTHCSINACCVYRATLHGGGGGYLYDILPPPGTVLVPVNYMVDVCVIE